VCLAYLIVSLKHENGTVTPAHAGMTALGALAITPAAIFTVKHRMIRADFAHCDYPI
jgi:hypothetical protein